VGRVVMTAMHSVMVNYLREAFAGAVSRELKLKPEHAFVGFSHCRSAASSAGGSECFKYGINGDCGLNCPARGCAGCEYEFE
jgi:hypothetical protein